jgi:hypothetical protein
MNIFNFQSIKTWWSGKVPEPPKPEITPEEAAARHEKVMSKIFNTKCYKEPKEILPVTDCVEFPFSNGLLTVTREHALNCIEMYGNQYKFEAEWFADWLDKNHYVKRGKVWFKRRKKDEPVNTEIKGLTTKELVEIFRAEQSADWAKRIDKSRKDYEENKSKS